MVEVFVLDTSAWIALDEQEPGAGEAESLLARAWLGQVEVHASFATLTELEYIRTQELDALKGVIKLQPLPPKTGAGAAPGA